MCNISEVPAFTDLDSFLMAGGTVDDNCGIDSASFVLLSEVSDSMTCPETVTRTYQISDSCGNLATCTQLIVINDMIAPVLICPGQDTAVCDASEVAPFTTLDDFTAAGGMATDSCGIDASSFTLVSEISDGATCPEIVTRTYRIEDLCGNAATCVQTIYVNDTIPPMITCPSAPAVALCDASEVPVFATIDSFILGGGQVSDNCVLDSASFTLISETTDSMMCPETVTRVYQVADSCGNVATCAQTIIVNDVEAPVLTCPPADTAICDISEIPAFATLADFVTAGGMATDSCGINDTTFTLLSEVFTGSCPAIYTRTYIVSDLCGNTATCAQTIVVNDTIEKIIG